MGMRTCFYFSEQIFSRWDNSKNYAKFRTLCVNTEMILSYKILDKK